MLPEMDFASKASPNVSAAFAPCAVDVFHCPVDQQVNLVQGAESVSICKSLRVDQQFASFCADKHARTDTLKFASSRLFFI